MTQQPSNIFDTDLLDAIGGASAGSGGGGGDTIIQDTIPKVSSDGEPHETLTIVAIMAGVIVSIVVLYLLSVMIDCRFTKGKQFKSHNQQSINNPSSRVAKNIFSSFGGGKRQSFNITTTDEKDVKKISTISINVPSNYVATIYVNEKDQKFLPNITTIAF